MTPRHELPGPNDWGVLPSADGFRIGFNRRYWNSRIIAAFFDPPSRYPQTISLKQIVEAKRVLSRSST